MVLAMTEFMNNIMNKTKCRIHLIKARVNSESRVTKLLCIKRILVFSRVITDSAYILRAP